MACIKFGGSAGAAGAALAEEEGAERARATCELEGAGRSVAFARGGAGRAAADVTAGGGGSGAGSTFGADVGGSAAAGVEITGVEATAAGAETSLGRCVRTSATARSAIAMTA
jgi:hypothetical protein